MSEPDFHMMDRYQLERHWHHYTHMSTFLLGKLAVRYSKIDTENLERYRKLKLEIHETCKQKGYIIYV
jgi:hypothetical protein